MKLSIRLRVLEALSGRKTAAELGEAIRVSPYSVSRALCELNKQGLVQKVGMVRKAGFARMVWERVALVGAGPVVKSDIRPLMDAWPMPVELPQSAHAPRVVMYSRDEP